MSTKEKIKLIQCQLERVTQDILFWMDRKNRSRKNALIAMRAMHEQDCRNKKARLLEELANARKQLEAEKAQAFVARLASVRKDWENGLFD